MTEKDREILSFPQPVLWREWLMAHHEQTGGVWLRLFKKNSGIESLNYAQALDEALCFGWIDGQIQKYDEQSWLQLFTPRRKASVWSAKNTQNIERLTLEGKMQPAGLREVAMAKADGRWQRAYQSQGKAKPPEDFIKALAENPEANRFFLTLDKANAYAVYYRLQNARTPEARANRIAMFIAMFEKGQKFHE